MNAYFVIVVSYEEKVSCETASISCSRVGFCFVISILCNVSLLIKKGVLKVDF